MVVSNGSVCENNNLLHFDLLLGLILDVNKPKAKDLRVWVTIFRCFIPAVGIILRTNLRTVYSEG